MVVNTKTNRQYTATVNLQNAGHYEHSFRTQMSANMYGVYRHYTFRYLNSRINI